MIGTVARHGRTRRDTKNLVAHLLKEPEARVEISGSLARDLSGALREMEIARDGSRADAAFLHISLSPSRAMGRDELRQTADIVLRHLGAEDRRDAQHALARETQLAARARLSAEAKAKPVADEARDELATIKRAEALLKERPDLARRGADAVLAEARRQLLEEQRRQAEEAARRQHRPAMPEPEPEPVAGPRFG